MELLHSGVTFGRDTQFGQWTRSRASSDSKHVTSGGKLCASRLKPTRRFPRIEPILLTARVFVLRARDCVYLFDEHGALLDEPDHGTPGGRHALEGDENFLDEWRGEAYYRLVLHDMEQEEVLYPRA